MRWIPLKCCQGMCGVSSILLPVIISRISTMNQSSLKNWLQIFTQLWLFHSIQFLFIKHRFTADHWDSSGNTLTKKKKAWRRWNVQYNLFFHKKLPCMSSKPGSELFSMLLRETNVPVPGEKKENENENERLQRGYMSKVSHVISSLLVHWIVYSIK